MRRCLALAALATVALAACENEYAGGGGGLGPPFGPLGGTSEPVTPLEPSPMPTAKPDATVSRADLVEAGVKRAGLPVSAQELAAAGWTIDLNAGRADYHTDALGSETVTWTVPPRAFVNQTLYLSGSVTSRFGSNLALQVGLKASGFEYRRSGDGAYSGGTYYEETGVMSTNAVMALAPQIGADVKIRLDAVPGEEATVEINLGWQAPGFVPYYRYVYQP